MLEAKEETPGMSGNSSEGYDQVGGQLVVYEDIHFGGRLPQVIARHLSIGSLLHSLYVYRHIDSENLKDKDKRRANSLYLLASEGVSCLSLCCVPTDRQRIGEQPDYSGGCDE